MVHGIGFVLYKSMLVSFQNPHVFPGVVNEPQNLVIHSRLSQFENKRIHRGVSVKYVIKGKEVYKIDGQTHAVTAGHFLLVNHLTEIETFIHEPEPVEAMCVYVKPQLISEVFQGMTLSPEAQLDHPFEMRLGIPQFQEQIYKPEPDRLGRWITSQAMALQYPGPRHPFLDASFYYQLAESMLDHQSRISEQIQRLDCVKVSTRKELYRRLTVARHFLQDNYQNEIDLDLISQEACLSKYHFLRLFRQVYGVTPHQFLITFRLERARKLLCDTPKSLFEICQLIGLKDLSSFGRRFKKAYGFSPAAYRRAYGR